MIHLVDDKHCRSLIPFNIFPDKFGTYFYTVGSIQHNQGSVGNFQWGNHFAYKIIKTRCVEDIDFIVSPVHKHLVGEYGVFTFVFNIGIVGNHIMSFYSSATPDRPAFVQHGFCECSLTTSGMAEQNYISEVFGIGIHNMLICFFFVKRSRKEVEYLVSETLKVNKVSDLWDHYF